MENVRPLRATDLSPEMVLETIKKEVASGSADEMFTIIFYKDQPPAVFVTGDLSLLPHVALIFQDTAVSYIRGELTPSTEAPDDGT